MVRQRQLSEDLDDARAGESSARSEADRDRVPDRFGDLPRDPSGDRPRAGVGSPARDLSSDLCEDEVWFEAEELAAASRVELGQPPDPCASRAILACGPSLDQLAPATAIPGISLASLPGWPGADAAGQGLGAALGELIGELRPGDVVAITGAQRGVGRSSLLAQLADGLALRAGEILTPVACVVEGGAPRWRTRSFARWSGLDARVLLDAAVGARVPDLDRALARFATSSWTQLERRQRFVEAPEDALGDAAARRELVAGLRRWRVELAPDRPDAVWPVLVVDPIEASGPIGADRIAIVAELAALAREEGLLVLLSCDEPAVADTRRFDRHVAARLHATAPAASELEIELCHRPLGPRGRVRLGWDRGSGRIAGVGITGAGIAGAG